MDKELEETLKAQIAAETDLENKELYSMMYFGLVYTNYIKETNPELHERAMRYALETNELKGVDFTKGSE
jgi:hypothetical protein